MRRPPALAALLVLHVGAAAAAAASALVPVVRVVDVLPAAAPPGAVVGADATIDGETRRALLARQTHRLTPRVGADGKQRVVALPPDLVGVARLTLVRDVRFQETRIPLPDVVVTPQPDARQLVLPPNPTDTMPGMHTAVELRVPDVALADWDVTTAPITVPPEAVLALGVGLEGDAAVAPAAYRFTITAVDDARTAEVWEETVERGTTWHDRRVPLGALAGRRVRLRFAARALDGSAVSALAPAWGEPIVLAPATSSRALRGVVLVSLDTVRAASVSAYGCARPTTPAFDAFAAAGVVAADASAPAPHTLPSHMTMLTGLYPRTHGVRTLFTALGPRHATLPERLRDAGFATGAVTEDAFVVPALGFRRGFDAYREHPSPGFDAPEGHAAETFGDGLAWLARNRDRPFFLFLHTYQAHWPYTPPRGWDTLFGTPPAWPLDQERRRYEQEIRYLDDQLGVFLDGLAALGLAEGTLVVVTADHGEEFGEHGGQRHGFALHEETLHVPLAFRLPGMLPAGRVVDEPVSLVDVTPTILDLLDLAPVPDADGTSLLPLLLGTAERLPRPGVFADAPAAPNQPIELTAVRTRSVACLVDASTASRACWDRRGDPTERWPLDDRDRADARDALAAAVAFAGGGPPAAPPVPARVDPDRAAGLRALGYVQ